MAINFEVYQKQSWPPQTPITQDRMDKVEKGIEDNRDDVRSLQSTIQTVTATLSNKANASDVADSIRSLTQMIENSSGNLAWDELLEAGVQYDNVTHTVSKSLNTVLLEIKNSISYVGARQIF